MPAVIPFIGLAGFLGGRPRGVLTYPDMRKGATVVFVLLGTLLTLVAVDSFWLARNVVDRQKFSQTAVSALQSVPVSEMLAVKIWDSLRQDYPALDAVEPTLAEKAIAEVLRRPSLQGLMRRTATQAHQVVVSRNQGDVDLDLGNNYPVVLEAVYEVDPALADRLPSLVGLKPIVLADSAQLPDLHRQAALVPWVALFAGVMAALAFILALAASEERSGVLALAGFSLALVFGLEVLALSVLRPSSFISIADPDAKALVEAGYAVFGRGLRSVALLVAVVGLFIGTIGWILGRRRVV
jgi:hypothetical protein